MTTTSRAARVWADCACASNGMRPNIAATHVSAPKTTNALKNTVGFIFFSPQVGSYLSPHGVRKSLFRMNGRAAGNERVILRRNGGAKAVARSAGTARRGRGSRRGEQRTRRRDVSPIG